MATMNLTRANRKRLARAGVARPDGSYPIGDEEDLHNAVADYGRTGSDPAVKAHIISRARTLGLVSKLPESWHVS